jgi:DNA recombination protein RmuC
MNNAASISIEPWILWLLIAAAVFNALVLLWLAVRRADKAATAAAVQGKTELLGAVSTSSERLERELRREITESSRGGRQELTQSFGAFQQAVVLQSGEAFRTQNTQIDALIVQSSQQLATLQKTLADTLTTQLQGLSESNARRMNEVRETMEKQLSQLQTTNSAKLDEMRATVDEKLQTTLQARLGESFKQVADRLEQVHKGLGEMQTLAQGVGDLRHFRRSSAGQFVGASVHSRSIRRANRNKARQQKRGRLCHQAARSIQRW